MEISDWKATRGLNEAHAMSDQRSVSHSPLKTLRVATLIAWLMIAGSAHAEEWRFGIGTGFSSFSLDGDIGFATPAGGVIADIDLSNSDTSDLLDSAFGFAAFAMKDPWKINFVFATLTLEDKDSGLSAEWDKTQYELSVEYRFAKTGQHAWAVLFGVRGTDHEWDISTPMGRFKPEEDWTDAIVGLTHAVPFADRWSWTNRVDYGFGDSEGVTSFRTALNWQPYRNWIFNVNARYSNTKFGESGDIGRSDFYLYDIEEAAIGLGFAYTW